MTTPKGQRRYLRVFRYHFLKLFFFVKKENRKNVFRFHCVFFSNLIKIFLLFSCKTSHLIYKTHVNI